VGAVGREIRLSGEIRISMKFQKDSETEEEE
jgi:hypothetical protein